MVTHIFAGLIVAAASLKLGFQLYKANVIRIPAMTAARNYYKGGFQPAMTREEAAKILGIRQTAAPEKIVAAHRKIMMANHPDLGGSPFMATKINEAKTMLTQKGKSK
mmetsp:Transcript_37710/g.52242  ORF Transcript_37710/g.52242 Transcript_37710/m.52242 type:complete len:108 (-) Transcript_37710:31-354(-)